MDLINDYTHPTSTSMPINTNITNNTQINPKAEDNSLEVYNNSWFKIFKRFGIFCYRYFEKGSYILILILVSYCGSFTARLFYDKYIKIHLKGKVHHV